MTERNSLPIVAAQRRLGSAENRPIDSLVVGVPAQPRHSKRRLAGLAKSIEKFGFVMPVLLDEGGTVIAGAALIEAARGLGIDEVPVLVATAWTEQQIRDFQRADHHLSEESTWTDELLTAELSRLIQVHELLEVLEWEQSDMDLLLAKHTRDDCCDAQERQQDSRSYISELMLDAYRRELFRRLHRPSDYLVSAPNFFTICLDLALRQWASTRGQEPELGNLAESVAIITIHRASEAAAGESVGGSV